MQNVPEQLQLHIAVVIGDDVEVVSGFVKLYFNRFVKRLVCYHLSVCIELFQLLHGICREEATHVADLQFHFHRNTHLIRHTQAGHFQLLPCDTDHSAVVNSRKTLSRIAVRGIAQLFFLRLRDEFSAPEYTDDIFVRSADKHPIVFVCHFVTVYIGTFRFVGDLYFLHGALGAGDVLLLDPCT